MFNTGAVLYIEGDEGVLVPEPSRPPHRTSHQEDACQHLHARLHQAVSAKRTHSTRLISLSSFMFNLPSNRSRCRFEHHLTIIACGIDCCSLSFL